MKYLLRKAGQNLLANLFVATLASAPRVERAVLLGVVLTLALHVWRGLSVARSVDERGTVLRPSGVFWLGTDKAFADEMAQAVAGGGDLTIDLSAMPFLDDPALQAMRNADELLAERGDTLRWFGAPDGSERMLSVLQHGHALDEGELVD